MDKNSRTLSTPVMVVGDLDDRSALTLIETVLRLWRESRDSEEGLQDSHPITRRTNTSDGQVLHDMSTSFASDRAVSSPRRASESTSRVKYSIAPVRNGRTMQLKDVTPAALKVVDWLKDHPGSTLPVVMDGVRLSRNTVSNIFTILSKQGVLEKQSAT